jgi:DNA-binding transcriptional MerR regulator
LVVPVTRSASGYRIYDDQTLERLAFISRAKQLGCSLEEITDLVATWETERCGPVQSRFHALVTDKIREAQRQIIELAKFSFQLRVAAAQLSGPPVDGPCADDCACLSAAPRWRAPSDRRRFPIDLPPGRRSSITLSPA